MTTASFPLESKNPLKTVGASGSSTLAIILSSESLKNTSKHKSYLFCGQSNLLNDGREPALAKKIILFENIGNTCICDMLNFYEWKNIRFLTLCDSRIQCSTHNAETNDSVFDFFNHGRYNESQLDESYNKLDMDCMIF